MAVYNTYTKEQEVFLSENASCMSRKELTEAFNSKFNAAKSVLAIKSWCNIRGYNSSNDGKYKNGNKSWQTGLDKDEFKKHYSKESFARMTKNMKESRKTVKIGDEHIRDGTIYVATSLDYEKPFWERNTPKRRVVWEQAHGKIPDGYCVIHLDGNAMNCELDNLCCIPMAYKGIMAKNRWFTDSREHTLAAIKWCELYQAIKEVNK